MIKTKYQSVIFQKDIAFILLYYIGNFSRAYYHDSNDKLAFFYYVYVFICGVDFFFCDDFFSSFFFFAYMREICD